MLLDDLITREDLAARLDRDPRTFGFVGAER